MGSKNGIPIIMLTAKGEEIHQVDEARSRERSGTELGFSIVQGTAAGFL